MNLMRSIVIQAKDVVIQAKDVIIQLWQLWLTAVTVAPTPLKSLTFFFWLKNKIPLMRLLTLLKIFPYLLNFPSTSSNLVTCLALYKEDQATHHLALSHPLFWNFIHLVATYTFSYFSISLTKSPFIDNNTTHMLQHHYPLPIFPTLHYSEISSLCYS